MSITIINGKLIVAKTSRGKLFAEFISDEGKKQSISFWHPTSEEYNDKPVELHRDGSTFVALRLSTGEYLYQKQSVSPAHLNSNGGNKIPENMPINFPDSFKIAGTTLFDKTKSALAGFYSPDNFNLKFYKGAPFEKSELKFMPVKTDKKEIKYILNADFGDIDFAAINSRNISIIKKSGLQDAQVDVENTWRWITGMGNLSVYENGITLHHVYGIPYIPGSSIKGMLRNWIIAECFDNEGAAQKNEVFQVIFGINEQDDSEGRQGKVYFFDAFPTEPPVIEPDIMNNHYQEYYEGNTPPADWLNPNPIFFMSVKGGKLKFIIGIKEINNEAIGVCGKEFINDRLGNNITTSSTVLQLAEAWLKDALENNGVGAKTAVGYGRMAKL